MKSATTKLQLHFDMLFFKGTLSAAPGHRFVTRHDFSRAEGSAKMIWALAPEGCLDPVREDSTDRVADASKRCQQPVPALTNASFSPFQLPRVDASGVPAPRQCVSRLTA